MNKSLVLSEEVNFSIDHNEIWWLEAPKLGLTVMLAADMQDRDILFDQNDNQLVFSGTSTFAVFTQSTLTKARKLKRLTNSDLTVQPKFEKELVNGDRD